MSAVPVPGLPRHAYLHVPFCGRRCSYCDFAIAVRRIVPAEAFARGVAAELRARFGAPAGAEVDTLYLGGGTPSRLGGDGVARTLDAMAPWLTPAPGAEVTLEANPEDVTPAAARRWAALGIGRVSLGVQSFDPAVLRWMHRTHDADDARRAVEVLRDAGIGALSLDLIFALPPEVPRDWGRDLDAALALAPGHLSVYGLTVEPATPLGRWTSRGEVHEAPEGRYAEEFLAADRTLVAAGYAHYEVSNYARPGARARHNSAYWTGVPYVGLGPGAHGFDGAVRRWNVGAYAAWQQRVDEGRDPMEGADVLDGDARAAERVYLGLRTTDGLALAGAQERTEADRWVAAGWATHDGGRVRLTPEGWLRMDALAAALTARKAP